MSEPNASNNVEALTEIIFQVMGDGICIVNNHREVVKYNPAFISLWNIPSTAINTPNEKSLFDFLLSQLCEPQVLIDQLCRISRLPRASQLVSLQLRDGRIFELSSTPITLNEQLETSIWHFRDITKTEIVKQSLTEKIALQDIIFDHLPDLIWFKDPAENYLTCNQRYANYLGVSVDELRDKTDDNVVDYEFYHRLNIAFKQALSTARPATHQTQSKFAADGHRKVIETTATPIYDDTQNLLGVLGIARDITEHHQTEEELKQVKERLRFAMRGGNDGLWDWDLETNEVYYSPFWKSMLGYADGELSNHLDTWKRLIHPDECERVFSQVRDYITGKTTAFESEIRMRHKKGHEVIVLSRAFIFYSPLDRKAARLVGTQIDITAHKRSQIFNDNNAQVLKMIATGKPAPEIYNKIALMYEERHPGMHCSMLELKNGTLFHGGAPSLPPEYCQAVHGLRHGPNVGSCGTSTYTGKRVLVKDIATDPKWSKIKEFALPHGLRSCWSEPIKSSSGKILGAFGMYYCHPALPNRDELNDLVSAARLAGIVMERDQTQKRIQSLAYTDELTGLASRAYFYQILEEAIASYHQTQHCFSLLYLDLDDFKGVNDSLGHDAGDLLLREVARRLQSASRESDFVARLSGDEFCILVQDIEEESAVLRIAQRYLKMLSKPVELITRKVIPACSIGIAHYPEDGQDLSTLFKAADTSLYAAKEQGKNQYAVYKPELTRQAEHRFRIEQSLREAVERQELSLVYQPQIRLDTGSIIAVEALSRWHHPQLGWISPIEFIATAERIGMIKQLTERAIFSACHQAVAWKKAGLPSLRMAVNISPIHFLDDDFVLFIQRVIDETGILPCELELEVTESVVQTDPQNLNIFRRLKEIGVLLSIDDFGTGYSSFASLKHVTIDYLKIDKYFIDDMMQDSKSQILIASIIEMGHNLGHRIIAEGVETSAQCRLLQTLGCDTAQGYLFSKPVSGGQIYDLLNAVSFDFSYSS
ncbi:MAG: bifunctional diguanylate cyclase/phosphodiesterase [Cyanobacteria bacterium P01_H01_bin.15]